MSGTSLVPLNDNIYLSLKKGKLLQQESDLSIAPRKLLQLCLKS